MSACLLFALGACPTSTDTPDAGPVDGGRIDDGGTDVDAGAIQDSGTPDDGGTDEDAGAPIDPCVIITDAGPTEVDAPFVSISAAHSTTCAIKSTGSLYCWGVWGAPHLPQGDDDHPAWHLFKPVRECTAAKDWQVSSASYTTCAIKADGRLFCWGRNDEGSAGLGYGGPVRVPKPLDGNWRTISTNASHTCGTTLDDVAYCWGKNDLGQVGDGTTISRYVPTPVSTAEPLGSANTELYATIGLTADGRIIGWGSNATSLLPVEATPLEAGWVAVDGISVEHACGVHADGTLWCWGGGGGVGLLGDGTTGDSELPVQEATGRTDWVDVRAGGSFRCALTAGGEIFCWGDGVYGVLADGDGDHHFRSVPTQEITMGSDWVALDTGQRHACALKADGTAWCWGADVEFWGVLGTLNPLEGTPSQVDPIQ